jgi:hypothetical protein
LQGRLGIHAFSVARVLTAAALALAVLMWLGPLATEARQGADDRVTPISPTLTFLPCVNKAGDRYRAKVEPKRCAHFGRGGAFAGGVNLRDLIWQNWGEAIATATGVECGFHLPCEQITVQVQAFRVRKACGRRIYTRLKAVSEFGKTLVKTRACLGPA